MELGDVPFETLFHISTSLDDIHSKTLANK